MCTVRSTKTSIPLLTVIQLAWKNSVEIVWFRPPVSTELDAFACSCMSRIIAPVALRTYKPEYERLEPAWYIIWKLTFLKQCALRLALITVSGASPQFNSLPGTTYHSPTNLPTTKFLSTGNIELWNNHDLSKMSLVISSVSIRFQCSVTSDFSPWEVIQCSYKVCRQLKTYGKFFSVMYYGILDFFLSAFNSPWKHCKFTKSSVSLIPKVLIKRPWLKSVLASEPFEYYLSSIPNPPPPPPIKCLFQLTRGLVAQCVQYSLK